MHHIWISFQAVAILSLISGNELRVDVRENQTNVKNRGKVQKFKSFQIFMLHRHQCDKKRAVVFLGKYYLLFEKKNILKCLS